MRRGAAAALALALACCLSAGCSGGGESAGERAPAGEVEAPAAALAQAFGPAIALARDRSPAVFEGDFDGDGRPDLIAFARAEGSAGAIPADVQVLQPWTPPGSAPPGDLSKGADLMLAVVHAGGIGAGNSFLLHDPDTLSILDTGAAREAFVIDRAGAGQLEAEVGRRARGDVLVIPTEAGIDTYLYWDGSAYRAFQPLEYP